jgi:outer membrane protein OmpA-like peptidoglycan-associated protein
MDEQDDGAKVGLWVVLGIISLLLIGLIGGLAMRAVNAKHAKAVAVAATPAAAPVAAAPVAAAVAEADVMIDVPLAGEIVARVFFELDRAELQPDATMALALAVKALSDAPGKKLVIAGFHDPSGNAEHNAELAKQRAKAVRAALTTQGADPARVQLRKPEQTALGGPPEEARRVEVRLVD